ncbi:MAG: cation transporter [Lachnospiraceae bacterium]|nr:cation transporter [Lachnospiraceae bacterium]
MQANKEQKADRNRIIVRTSLIGIGANVLLAAFKAAVGVITNSIAVTLDSVNNLSDALSSLITIAGARLASRNPDKKHPLGHGRVEYLSAMIVSAIVLYAGLTSLVTSVKKIIHPETASYGRISLLIIAVAVAVKLLLGRYVKKKGEDVGSGALIASGKDAMFDAVISLSVLLSAILYIIAGISAEAYVGVLISIMIIKAGIEMMLETYDDILGKRADEDVSRTIKKILNEEPEVLGAYDLFLNNYGPDRNYGSVHLELPDTMTVAEVDELTRRVEARVYYETGVILTGVGVYAYNTKDDEAARIRNDIQNKVLAHDWALQIHGFNVDTANRKMRFDVVMSFDINPKEGLEILMRQIREAYPDYEIMITPDLDLTD